MSDPFNFPQQDLLRYREVLLDAVERMTVSGQVILGEGVRRFESEFAAWLGSELRPDQVIGVANGTDALELALRAAGVLPGDRVLLPAHTAYATAAAVLRVEAVPVFVDLDEGRAVLSPPPSAPTSGDPGGSREWRTVSRRDRGSFVWRGL